MFESFVLGLFAPVVGAIGILLFIWGVIDRAHEPILIPIGFLIFLGAGYMKYLSSHTQRIRD